MVRMRVVRRLVTERGCADHQYYIQRWRPLLWWGWWTTVWDPEFFFLPLKFGSEAAARRWIEIVNTDEGDEVVGEWTGGKK